MRAITRTATVGLRGAAAALAVALSSTSASAAGVHIPFTRTQLPNGMTVILHEDHTLPLVVVNVSYAVGSRYETARRTGFAHLFEHLMFMGTARAPTKMFDAWMEGVGGSNNAWTSEDRTDYHEQAPSTVLPLLLWLEADRLRDLGPLMTRSKLDAQREVVRNERRQTSENEPYGKAELRLPELVWPEKHPYHHPVIGSHADLEAATVDDVKDFFATWYAPSNASIVVAGDFQTDPTLDLVRRQFGTIPSRPAPKDPGAPGFDPARTTLTGVVRETMEDDVELAKVMMVWQTPRHFGPGDAELDILGNALAQGKASRLYKTLVYDMKLAQSVQAVQASAVLASTFRIEILARPGADLARIEAVVDAELGRVRGNKLAEEELTRAKNGIETSFVMRLESVSERASILNMYQAEVGDPAYTDKDMARYRDATAEGIRTTAATWLDPGKRVVVRVVPRKKKP